MGNSVWKGEGVKINKAECQVCKTVLADDNPFNLCGGCARNLFKTEKKPTYQELEAKVEGLVESLESARHSFTSIRAYTQDADIAIVCIEAEQRINKQGDKHDHL